MRILLTGSDGFTGKHFIEMAIAAGHEVIPLRADLKEHESVQREVLANVPEAVVHLAAVSFVGHADANAFYAVNVLGTTNLLESLVKLPIAPKCVLLASSANIYGNCNESPISEIQPPCPINHYAMSKLAMEFMSQPFLDRLPIVITRPFNYTGPGQAANFVIPKLVNHFVQCAHTISLGNLDVEREFNDVKFVCNAYLQLLAYGEAGETYNVCTGRTYTLGNVIEKLEKITGHKIRIEINSEFVRLNEVHRLCGDPTKLQKLFKRHRVNWNDETIEYSLQKMLATARESTND